MNQWFYQGLPDKTKFTPKDGIDSNKALRHIGAVIRSFEPAHEHKVYVTAYLLSLWFEDIVLPDTDPDLSRENRENHE